MIRNVTINYKGLELTCKGYHTPFKDNGHDLPPDYPTFEIDCVCYDDTDVTELLTVLNIDWSEIEDFCLKKLS
jgi:hypothetical protein